MKYIYGSFALLAILSGMYFFFAAKSAVHEIEGLILFLIAAVLIVAAEVSEGFSRSPQKKPKQAEPKQSDM